MSKILIKFIKENGTHFKKKLCTSKWKLLKIKRKNFQETEKIFLWKHLKDIGFWIFSLVIPLFYKCKFTKIGVCCCCRSGTIGSCCVCWTSSSVTNGPLLLLASVVILLFGFCCCCWVDEWYGQEAIAAADDDTLHRQSAAAAADHSELYRFDVGFAWALIVRLLLFCWSSWSADCVGWSCWGVPVCR